jgi:hypothetical protein
MGELEVEANSLPFIFLDTTYDGGIDSVHQMIDGDTWTPQKISYREIFAAALSVHITASGHTLLHHDINAHGRIRIGCITAIYAFEPEAARKQCQ